jgi:hypothetical protein
MMSGHNLHMQPHAQISHQCPTHTSVAGVAPASHCHKRRKRLVNLNAILMHKQRFQCCWLCACALTYLLLQFEGLIDFRQGHRVTAR